MSVSDVVRSDFEDRFGRDLFSDIVDFAGQHSIASENEFEAEHLPEQEETRLIFGLYELLSFNCFIHDHDHPFLDGLSASAAADFLAEHREIAYEVYSDHPPRGGMEERMSYPEAYPPRKISLHLELDQERYQKPPFPLDVVTARFEQNGAIETVTVAVLPWEVTDIPTDEEAKSEVESLATSSVDYVLTLPVSGLQPSENILSDENADIAVSSSGYSGDTIPLDGDSDYQAMYGVIDMSQLSAAREQLDTRIREGWPEDMPEPERETLQEEYLFPDQEEW
jgi:hypothetical protein